MSPAQIEELFRHRVLGMSDDMAPAKAARATWARFIKKVFAAAPGHAGRGAT